MTTDGLQLNYEKCKKDAHEAGQRELRYHAATTTVNRFPEKAIIEAKILCLELEALCHGLSLEAVLPVERDIGGVNRRVQRIAEMVREVETSLETIRSVTGCNGDDTT